MNVWQFTLLQIQRDHLAIWLCDGLGIVTSRIGQMGRPYSRGIVDIDGLSLSYNFSFIIHSPFILCLPLLLPVVTTLLKSCCRALKMKLPKRSPRLVMCCKPAWEFDISRL
uniref:SJCHGC04332 protein n=1 Tax=Schistosoma japonicum TaxID=6182 RepID=Q5DDJ3_SCHJA|nr:SJCHGC04332 protein [Schistosoma japonicum]